jgi:serine/threonine-protein kinase
MIATVDRLVELIHDSRILNPARLTVLRESLQGCFRQPYPLAKELLRRGWLTDYQLEQIIKGRGQDLILGPYIILEPIGAGHLGEVFKALHRKNEKLVALKVIRKERRGDLLSLSRFRREIHALGQLSHPNVVSAYGMDEVGVAHYYAMEYVEGINLNQLIGRVGQVPIAPACDYIRQAALGLQHAHEHGLIHRDIKPANLLIMQAGPETNPQPRGLSAEARERFGRWGTIKLLDLDLVLRRGKEPVSNSEGRLTLHGLALGTVDYMAPEQVDDPHGVDIRADLYSLGCTFYEMLAGHAPFPDGTPVEKVCAHRTREAVPVQQERPEIPENVAAVVSKLLVKQPAQRYQTPGEVSAALAGILVRMEPGTMAWDWKPPATDDVRVLPSGADVPELPHMSAIPPSESRSGSVVWLAAGVLLLLSLIGLLALLYP